MNRYVLTGAPGSGKTILIRALEMGGFRIVEEAQRIAMDGIFSNPVFLIENLGFCHQTEARRISFEEALRFEQVHRETNRELGFNLSSVPPGSVQDRTRAILGHLSLQVIGVPQRLWPI